MRRLLHGLFNWLAARVLPREQAEQAPPVDALQEAFSSPITEDDELTLLHAAAPQLGASIFDDLMDSRGDLEVAPLGSDSRVKVAYEQEAEEDEKTSPAARILITAVGDSDRGRKRRANEDSLLCVPERSLFAVADGMGGYHGGQVASTLAVETLRQTFEQENFGAELRADQPVPRRGHELASAVLQANLAVFQAARSDAALSRMGTTLVTARFSANKQRVYIANVGDSRCYRFRAGKLSQLTTDQTMRQIGLKGPGANDLWQAIGHTSDLAIDLLVDKPRPDDVYLLCSDGLPKMVQDDEIEQLLTDEPDLEAAVYGLIELANDRGGKDNVTVVLIKVIERVVRAAPFAGWSKLPDALQAEPSSVDDNLTLIGSVSFDEPTQRDKLPPEAAVAGGRKP